jgi:carbamoyl-phosphate synthase large subunit
MKHLHHNKVLVLGSGALKIGEAGEFDYSGSQAIKALKDEGITTILVNPNIATIQTSDHLADEIYFLPVDAHFVSKVIEKERPTGIMIAFGGQTALNCGLELNDTGVLQDFGVEVLGTPINAIRDTEDRERFVNRLNGINIMVPRSAAAVTSQQAVDAARNLGYPVMLRAAYALGGLGSGVCTNDQDVRERAAKALAHSPQVLIEEYLGGWKEIEYEVVRDRFDNCVTVCNMENIDPMGIHTGESIVVAPSQTLSNAEYHMLRDIAIRVVRELGIVGECNIQFALAPDSSDYRVIEVNARLSRSSALASKATGYPLALVAAKLALGYSLTELRNSITGVTTACFEPALDYVVVKVPRWDSQKFRMISRTIGSGMKSVGEVMAIGRNLEEALQKALRMLEIGAPGFAGKHSFRFDDLAKELREPTHERIFAIAQALRDGFSIEQIHALSAIDKWFLYRMRNIIEMERRLSQTPWPWTRELLLEAKRLGFSDRQIAALKEIDEEEVRITRLGLGIVPLVKQIDTLAAEYPAHTNYLYLTYNAQEDDIAQHDPKDGRKTVIVLGSGAYRIGSSVEFDWCCVNAVRTLRELNYRTIVVNYNPETVSTDYNECDTLYFEEIQIETLLAICQKERPAGVIIAMGGQVPNNLALALQAAGVPILGTSAKSIDAAEDRHKFSALLDRLGIEQPEWRELINVENAKAFAKRVGYPVLIRPSYVLSGAAMAVASNDGELERFLTKAARVSLQYPVVMSKFVEDAKELEIDAVASRGEIVASAISEHVENAGVHSGDATLVLPPQRIYLETIRRIEQITERIASALSITGPFNIQFIAKGNEVKVIECNLRASRSFPFVSKILGKNFIDVATRLIVGKPVTREIGSLPRYVGVKAPQFSFMRLEGADPTLGVEMASTGEVGCLGDDFEEAFLKALLSVGYRLPVRSILLSTGPVEYKAAFTKSASILSKMNVTLYATKGTADFLKAGGIDSIVLHWPLEKASPNVLEYLQGGKIDLVINIPKTFQEEELTNDYLIRRRAVDLGVPLITNIQFAQRFVEAIARKQPEDLQIEAYSHYAALHSEKALRRSTV